MNNSIFQFLNYREFLQTYYNEQKSLNPNFSFQTMAWKAGFRSKSFFKDVMSGKKNLSSASIFSIAKSIGLEGQAFSYFEALVTFNQAKLMAEKDHAFRTLAQYHKRGKAQIITQDQFEFYSNWVHNTIRELVTLSDFGEDYSKLGKLLKPAISTRKANASVKLLLRLGLLKKEKNRYLQTDKSITTGDEVKGVAIGSFHKQNMELASEIIDTLPAAERDISCLVAGLSPAGFAIVKAEIQNFRKKLIEIIRNDAPATQVYHINFQIFPTSEKSHD